MDLLSVIVPIFGLIAVGWLLKAIGLFPRWLVKALNDYVYYVGITVITFLSLHDVSYSLLLDPMVYALTVLPIAAVVLIAFAAARLMKLEKAAVPVFVICAFFGNTGYIGFPLNIAAQGRESLALTAFVSTIYTVIVFTFGAYLCQRYSDKEKKGLRLHTIPVFWAAAAGILLSFVALPEIVRLPLVLIEDSTSPLALLATGAMISAIGMKENLKPIGAISAIKLLLMPAIVAVTAVAAGVSGTVYRTSVLEAATPVGVTNTVLAQQFGLDERLASGAVVISTLLFFLTMPLVLLLI
ncbi:MAG: Membrane transport protein [Methanocella sp. PtaU1.Bin125]|nr:MAG: Membrane transport protein [Methanocella sp. PtaU1.Bin125]